MTPSPTNPIFMLASPAVYGVAAMRYPQIESREPRTIISTGKARCAARIAAIFNLSRPISRGRFECRPCSAARGRLSSGGRQAVGQRHIVEAGDGNIARTIDADGAATTVMAPTAEPVVGADDGSERLAADQEAPPRSARLPFH